MNIFWINILDLFLIESWIESSLGPIQWKNEYSKKIAHPYMVVMVLALYLLLMMKIDYKVDDDVKVGVRKDGGGERWRTIREGHDSTFCLTDHSQGEDDGDDDDDDDTDGDGNNDDDDYGEEGGWRRIGSRAAAGCK